MARPDSRSASLGESAPFSAHARLHGSAKSRAPEGRRPPCYSARVRTLAATFKQARAHACAPVKLTGGWKRSVRGVSCAGDLSGPAGSNGRGWHTRPRLPTHVLAKGYGPRPSPTASVPSKQGSAGGTRAQHHSHGAARSVCQGRRTQGPEAARVACSRAPRAQAGAGRARAGEGSPAGAVDTQGAAKGGDRVHITGRGFPPADFLATSWGAGARPLLWILPELCTRKSALNWLFRASRDLPLSNYNTPLYRSASGA